ncbi:universal stress protein [Arthrobacter globiformis]|uniref:universal stress protein n=1 Tax=Arthrobacter globiformis TaxID=1665 RepID=UPI00279178A0|nr:universal stress protein [Arthrobacter globiformis]MDQ0620721.1 nucleotide-binding universal stress UspA family protein [Arthrobacter globiformis]
MSIIVGYIPTAEGTAALDRAITEAQKNQSRLVIINSSRGDAIVDKRYAQAEDISALTERLDREGIEHLVLQPVRGNDAANEVLEAAEKYRAELIVIGLRRRTPVGKLIMGSAAQQILLEASCPVLAVKAS